MKVIGRLKDGTEIGAWLLKANPDIWDLAAFAATGEDLDDFRLTPSYRVQMMKPGDPCVIWMTGPEGAEPKAGVWAIGEISSEPWLDDGDGDNPFWRDRGEAKKSRPYIGIDVGFLSAPIERHELLEDPAFSQAEVLRAPQMGNPVALIPEEYRCIERYLTEHDLWPNLQGTYDVLLDDADRVATSHLESLGWTVPKIEAGARAVAARGDQRAVVLVAVKETDPAFSLLAEEFDELVSESEPILLIVIECPGDGTDLEVVATIENWTPSEANFDRDEDLYTM